MSLAERKIRQMRCHIGVQVGAHVLTSLDSERDGAEMLVTPIGVYVKSTRRAPDIETIIPWSHIQFVTLVAEDSKPAKPKA